MSKFVSFAKCLARNDDGATAIEYGLLAALISVAIILIVGQLGQELNTTFTTIESDLSSANSGN